MMMSCYIDRGLQASFGIQSHDVSCTNTQGHVCALDKDKKLISAVDQQAYIGTSVFKYSTLTQFAVQCDIKVTDTRLQCGYLFTTKLNLGDLDCVTRMPVTTGAERMYDLTAQIVKERRASMSNDELPHHHTRACLNENRYCKKNFPKPPVTINDGNTHNDHDNGDVEDVCEGYHQGDKANHSLLRASSIITAAVCYPAQKFWHTISIL